MKSKKRKPNVAVLRTAGTNCDRETVFAFNLAGARAELLHINNFISSRKNLSDFDILAIPGGFSYGDDIAAGKILANELKYRLKDDILKFIASNKLVIGICNGFQVLVKAGILPGSPDKKIKTLEQQVTLTTNDSDKFEDRWVYLRKTKGDRRNLPTGKAGTKYIWTKNLPEIISLPVAHGEGKFVAKDKQTLEKLKRNGQVIFQYCDEKGELSGYPYNPNGSVDNIAGICDETGRIFGLMPHPERHIYKIQSPLSSLSSRRFEYGDGFQIFINGVEYSRRNL
ncbi:MAG: phosphoribosylformylglycinamidine synthase I [Candidatus Omnitrophota bacterium]